MPEKHQPSNDDSILKKPMTRRDVLRLAGTGGLGLLLGGGAIGTLLTTENKRKTKAAGSISTEEDSIPFYGAHQVKHHHACAKLHLLCSL